MPLESIFQSPASPTSSSATTPTTPTPSLSGNKPMSPSLSVSVSNGQSSPTSSPSGSTFASESPGKKSAPRRPLTRESGSRQLSIRQIAQEGAPAGTKPSTLSRKDTITVYDWFRAMDEEAEKEKALRGTLRGTLSRSKTVRPVKSTRVNSNFEFFMKQAMDSETHKDGGAAAPQDNKDAKGKAAAQAKAQPEYTEPSTLSKSKSMSRVETKYANDTPAAKKGTIRSAKTGTIRDSKNVSMDGASVLKPPAAAAGGEKVSILAKPQPTEINENAVIMDKQIAEDDESLKVFMQAWNMLDTFEEHLAVHVELAQHEEAKQLAKEQAIDPQSQLIDLSIFHRPSSPKESSESHLSTDLEGLSLTPRGEPAKPATEPTTKPIESATPTPIATPTPTPASTTPTKPTEPATPTAKITRAPTPPPEPATKATPSATEPSATPATPATPSTTEPPRPEPTLKNEIVAAVTTTTAPTATETPVETTSHTYDSAAEEGYTGPLYTKPIPNDFVENLLQYCADEGTSALVPRAMVEQMVTDAMELFKTEPTIVDIPLTSKVCVVGDIHGQFPDLVTVSLERFYLNNI